MDPSMFMRQFSHEDHDSGKSIPYKAIQKALRTMDLEHLPEHKEVIDVLVDKYKSNWEKGLGAESFVEDTFMRSQLRNAVFVGHINTDMDSIAGAIGAADLFRGTAVRAEEKVNGEIECAMNYVGWPLPPTFEALPGGGKADDQGKLLKVCLVDHNEIDQMTPLLKTDQKRMKRIVGLIDHHAVAASFSSSSPLFMDVRPWGSMSTIIFHTYLRNRVPISKPIAQLLLCAILSDTLNLKSGTTTPADRMCVALLAAFGEVEDIDDLAMKLFTAKTQWIVGLGAYEMVRGDQKLFVVGEARLSIAVLEVTAPEPVLEVAEDLLTQLCVFKYEKGDYIDEESDEKAHDQKLEVHCALLFVVDTVKQNSFCLVCGAHERFLMEKAFPNATWRAAGEGIRSPSEHIRTDQTLCDVGSLVSRKLDFMPRCCDLLQQKSEVPEWFVKQPADMQRLAVVLESGMVKPLFHDSVQVVWDKPLIKAAVFKDQKILRRTQIFD